MSKRLLFVHGMTYGIALAVFTLAGMAMCAWWGFRLIVGGPNPTLVSPAANSSSVAVTSTSAK